MIECSLRDFAGILSASADPHAHSGLNEVVRGVSIDSRTIGRGDAFFAFPGTRQHGLSFVAQAAERGAACVVTGRGCSAVSCPSVLPRLEVPDLQLALQQLAAWNRERTPCPLIAVTGSVGKTTTKQLIAAVLASQFRVVQSPANFNNELGVPLSLLGMDRTTGVAVLELGAGQPGDIRQLTELCRPDYGVVTAVTPVHLQSFGSLDAIRSTKQELVEAIPGSGRVFLNGDDPLVRMMQSVAAAPVTLFGTSPDCTIRGGDCGSSGLTSHIVIDNLQYRWQGGRHLSASVLAAVAAGRLFGLTDQQIATGVAEFRPDSGRGRVLESGRWTIIDESYNASPASVRAAIEYLCAQRDAGRRILILADMLELAASSAEQHEQIGSLLADSPVDGTYLIGRETLHTFRTATDVNSRSVHRRRSCRHFETLKELVHSLTQDLRDGDVVLVKGSRGMQLERVVAQLAESGAHSHPA